MKNLVTFLALMQWEYGPHFDPDYDILKEQKQSEIRRKRLKKLKAPCPYCIFNVRAGKDKCDECGKEFYKTAEEM